MIAFQCEICKKNLKCPDQYVGQVVKCPKCKTALKIRDPDVTEFFEGDGASPKRSWFRRVFGPPVPKAVGIQNLARKRVRNLQLAAIQLRDAPGAAADNLREGINDLRQQQYQKFLRETPVDALSAVASGAKLAPLRIAGLKSLSDLVPVNRENLLQLHGIGPATADKIIRGFSAIRNQARNEPVIVPPPDHFSAKYARILSGAFQKIQSRKISTRFVQSIGSFAAFGHSLLTSAELAGGLFQRLRDINDAEEQIATQHKRLEAWTKSDEVGEAESKASMLVEDLVPSDFSTVLNDYRNKYADYVALFEAEDHVELGVPKDVTGRRRDWPEFTDAWRQVHGVPHVVPIQPPPRVPSIHGGIATQIAQAVERVKLYTDDLRVQLRGYQEFGIKYLVHQGRTVLGDEMGLGKTIQALGAMVHLEKCEDARRYLVVAPASTLGNWVNEIEQRTDFDIRVLHGPFRDHELKLWHERGGLAVTSYTTLNMMSGLLRSPIDLLVADEAHYIKNPSAKRSQKASEIANISKRVVLMTGTPLENNPSEFINLIRICNPGTAASVETISFGGEHGAVDPTTFERRVSRVYVRRNQEDVLKELPDCLETEEWIELTEQEWSNYFRAVESRNLMAMRLATLGCNGVSSKLTRFEELIEDCREASSKVVVYSFFLAALDQIGQSLGSHYRIDGSVATSRRMGVIEAFNQQRGFAALICQIQAGGVGINLQSASTVVLLEPQLKPTTEWQAVKRVHRMGQSRRVVVHRLLAKNTVDQRMRELMAVKTLSFDEYARESRIKDVSAAARDTSLVEKRLVQFELDQLRKQNLVVAVADA